MVEVGASENHKKMTVVLLHFKQQAANTFLRFKLIAKKKKTVVFLNLLGKGLTQEINGDRGSI